MSSDYRDGVQYLAGYLVTAVLPPSTVRDAFKERTSIAHLGKTRFFDHYEFSTDSPIPKVDDPNATPPLNHHVQLCWGSTSILCLARHHEIALRFLMEELQSGMGITWRYATIDVDSFVKMRLKYSDELSEQRRIEAEAKADPSPSPDVDASRKRAGPLPPLLDHEIVNMTLRTESFRGMVKSLTLYGDNVVDTPFFRDQKKHVMCSSLALRSPKKEELRLGVNGAITFRVMRDERAAEQRIEEVMEVLRILKEAGFLTL